MRHLILLCLWFAGLTPPALAATVTKRPVLAAFSALRISGRFDLDYVRGPDQSVVISGDRYVVDNLRIAVADGVLTIARPHGFDLPKGDVITVRVTSPSLAELDTSGLVRAKLAGLAGTSFVLVNNGAAAATLAGVVGSFSIQSRGVASIDAGALQARTLTMLVRGQGNFRVFASQSANVRMYGEGRVDVLGHPPAHKFRALAYGIIDLK